ncbi:MFS transporter [Streptomyces sp. NPDC002685]|uniref:MFS transporter n=1 Tax=Streptomyces sp. NPDC002685 TaxID=3154540 RepID=UPI003317C453
MLRVRRYRWFFLAQLSSCFGDFMVAPALAFAVLGMSGSVGDLGLVLAARTVPLVALMLVGGALADRLPRYAVMVGADVTRALVQAATAVLVLAGHAQVGQLMALQAVHGAASALFVPAVSGLLQQTVPEGQRQEANALLGIQRSAAQIAAPLLATLFMVTAGAGWAIAVDALSFAISALCLARLRPARAAEPVAARGTRRLLSDLHDGWREFRSRAWVWSLIGAASLTNGCYAVFTVLGPEVSERALGGPGAWGAVLTGFGAGAVSGGAVALYIRPRRPLRFAVLAASLFAAPTLGMAWATSVPPVVVAAFVGGLGLMVFNPLWETVLQREVPAASLSKVSAYEWLGSYAMLPLGQALAGPAAALWGTRDTLLAVGLAHLVIALAPLAVRDVREMRDGPAERDTREARGPVAVSEEQSVNVRKD